MQTFTAANIKGYTIPSYIPCLSDMFTSPEIVQEQSRQWMFRNLDDNEILSWLRDFKVSHPAMYQKLLAQALKELPSERWNLIKWNLAETDHPVL